MLSMKNIRKIYRTDLIETHALDGVSVDVAAGEFVAVMGRSGSGKTTFLNVAGLLDTFDDGTYHLDGQDVSRLSDAEMSRIRNEKIGFIFQSFNLIPDLDVFDNVDVPLRYRRLSAPERKERIERAVEQVGLLSRLRHLPSQLSGGQPRSSPAASSSGSPSRASSRATRGSFSPTSRRGTSTRSCRARSWISSRRSTRQGRRSSWSRTRPSAPRGPRARSISWTARS